MFEKRKAAPIAIRFPDRFHSTKLQHCLTPRLLGRHAGADIRFGLESEMLLDLFLSRRSFWRHVIVDTSRTRNPRSAFIADPWLSRRRNARSTPWSLPSLSFRPGVVYGRLASSDKTAPAGCSPRCPSRRRSHLPAPALTAYGIERALINGKKIATNLLDAPCDAVTMQSAQYRRAF